MIPRYTTELCVAAKAGTFVDLSGRTVPCTEDTCHNLQTSKQSMLIWKKNVLGYELIPAGSHHELHGTFEKYQEKKGTVRQLIN